MALIQLTKYQQRSAAVKARFKLKRQARQTGKTFEDTRELIDDSYERRTNWVVLSRGERQSKKNIEQAAIHAKAYDAAAEVISDTWRGEDAEYKTMEILLPNGSRITGLPANPDTARGHSANIYLDEFAFHKDSRKIWTALFPTITRGYRAMISSTPQGKQNKFYDLDTAWSAKMADGDPHYWTDKLDIHQAVAEGLELRDEDGHLTTPEQLKEALGDDDAWDQEYLVNYLDEATAYLSYELIAACEDPELLAEPLWLPVLIQRAQELHAIYLQSGLMPPDFTLLDPSLIEAEHLYLGGDIARKRDYTVFWINRERQGLQETVAVIRLRKTPFFIQRAVLFSLLAHPQMRRACLDQTGLGLQLAEEAMERFGASLVEGIDFTTANKEVLATGLKRQMEDGIPRLPAEPYIRNSFHSIKKLASLSGHFRFDAERTDAAGHADEFWAEALALHAASASGPPAATATGDPYQRDWQAERSGLVSVGSAVGMRAPGGISPGRLERSRIFGGGHG
jgi:phage FluMu gp28-like protein